MAKNRAVTGEIKAENFKNVVDGLGFISGSRAVQFKLKSRDGKTSRRRSKVYFCSHPDDFEKWFAPVTDAILDCESVDIYYVDTAEVDRAALGQQLADMSLAVVPVTAKLLSEKNRIIDFDLPQLLQRKIAVLPVLIDGDAESFNSLVGTIEAIDMNKPDFKVRLSKFLNGALIGGEQRKRIEEEFAAKVFLSYRKKDIAGAKSLIKTLRTNPVFRDVIIWYDDYLTAGEDFNAEIEEALASSDLMLLLVTPNLVGGENYVNKIEYPMALKAGVKVLPVQEEETDEKLLKAQFEKLAPVIDGGDKNAVTEGALNVLGGKVKGGNEAPEHLYYIGLAYYYGVCADTNKKLGLTLLVKSAKAGYLPAIERINEIGELDADVVDGKTAIGLLESGLQALRQQMNGNMKGAAAERFLTLADGLVAHYAVNNRLNDAEKLIAELLKFSGADGRSVETLTKTARQYYRLATSAYLRGDLASAQKYGLVALDFIERVFKLDLPDQPNALYIHIYNTLMQISVTAGDYRKAAGYGKKVTGFFATVPERGNELARRAFAQFAVTYLNLCFATGEYDEGLTAADTALGILSELPQSQLNSEIRAQLYNVLGVCYYNAADGDKDLINEALGCMNAAVKIAEGINDYNPAEKYFRLAKYSLSFANVLSQFRKTELSTQMFKNIIFWCEDYDFNLQQRYMLYHLAVNSLANDLVAEKDYEGAINLYVRFIECVENGQGAFAEINTAAECANFRYRGSYIYKNFLADSENEKVWLMEAASYLGRIENAGGQTAKIAQMIRKAVADLK